MLLNKLLKILFVISLVLLIFLSNFKVLALNFNVYKEEFSKLNIYDKIPDADEHALNLINYYNNKEGLSNFFNEQEKLHLQDVKYLVNLFFIIFYITLILSLIIFIYFIYKKDSSLILNSILISSIIIILLQGLFFISNFSSLFIKFHEISFNNDLWLFNPNANIVNLFPEQFFYDIMLKIMVNSLVTSLILIILTLILKKFIVNKRFLNKRKFQE